MRRIDKKAMDVDKSSLRISSSMGISTKIFQQHLLKGLSSSFFMKKGQILICDSLTLPSIRLD